MKYLLFIAMLIACGHGNKPKSTSSQLDVVQAKRDLYIELAKAEVDAYGWLKPRCDGLLFNSLAAYSGFPVNPLLAEKEPGLWERHPDFSCFGNGSKSTISKDMFRGLFIYLLATNDCQNAKEIRAYGEEHGWKMGEGESAEIVAGRVLMTPTMSYQLSKIIDKVCGTKSARIPGIFLKDDFEAHLEVLGIYTDYLIHGGITDSQLKSLKEFSDESPRNALFSALYHKFTDGNFSAAISVLLDEALFPNRLPMDTDHYTHYLWQRNENEDWQPCTEGGQRYCEGLTHSGIDLMFVVKIMEN